jgi:hypothetical protein
MVFSRDRDIQHEQKIFSAIRESLLQDPRIDATNVAPPIKPIEWPAVVQGEVVTSDSPSTAPNALMDHQNPLERPAVAQGEVITSDSPSTVPNALMDHKNPLERPAEVQGEAITSDSPSTAPNALVHDQNPPPVSLQSEEISSDSPRIAPDASLILPKQSISNSEEESRDRSSVAKRLFRTGACGFIITVIVGSAFAWQSSDDTKKEMVKGWVNSLVRSSSFLPNNLPHESDVPVKAVSTTSTQPQSGATVILPTPFSEQPTPTTTESSSDLQQQLETIVGDLAIVRRIVEQVASRQDQMAQDIATLQEAQQNVSLKISAPPQSSIIRVRPRRKK